MIDTTKKGGKGMKIKFFKRIVTTVLVALMVLGSLAACGKG
jgi:hypothetical protein